MSGHSIIPVSILLRAGRLKRWREGRGRAFYAPLDSAFCIRVAWRFMPKILWKTARVREVVVHGLEKLEAIRGQRAVIAPNHPTNLDPLVLFELSRQLGEPFNYLASRESFSLPLLGWLMQKCGAYSIMRGVVDRAAIKTTRTLLVSGRKIVMFPEGLTYGQNDTLMPFHEGVVQFGFWALEDVKKAGPLSRPSELSPTADSQAGGGREGVNEKLYFVPVGLKYRYMKPMDREILDAIVRLESHIGLVPEDGKPVYERLRTVGESVVVGYEAAYGVRAEKGETLDDRILRMKNLWVARAAGSVGVQDNPSLPLGDRIRVVINALDRMVIAEDASEFTKQMMRRRHQETVPLYKDLERAGRFLATGARYVAEHPSDERYLEVISRIEEELFGITPPLGPRRAIVTIGEPIDVSAFYERYKSDSRKTVSETTRMLEDAVSGLIQP